MALPFALDNLTATVETTLLPTITLKAGSLANDEQGLLTKLLRPRVTLYEPGGRRLYTIEPAGPPETLPILPIVAGVGALVLLYFALR